MDCPICFESFECLDIPCERCKNSICSGCATRMENTTGYFCPLCRNLKNDDNINTNSTLDAFGSITTEELNNFHYTPFVDTDSVQLRYVSIYRRMRTIPFTPESEESDIATVFPPPPVQTMDFGSDEKMPDLCELPNYEDIEVVTPGC